MIWLTAPALADDDMAMPAALGDYAMNRESSGTAWLPDSTPMWGPMLMEGEWSGMAHGYINGVITDQGGKRGDSQTFSESMAMVMANRPLGPGKIGLRGMVSLDPLMGPAGYPLLFQTGETANGRDHLIDRQHPHDLVMELATSYSLPVAEGQSVFVYVGYPGEPALGPATFMHRLSGVDNPEAPIGHHWLDSTHITFGVVTMGYVWEKWKLEASAFNGREPDQERWNFDSPQFNSQSMRLGFNPTPNWSLQVSQGYLRSPEALTPGIDQRRSTASATYNLPLGEDNWQTTLAFGRDENSRQKATHAWLIESAYNLARRHTFFGRFEAVDKDELFEAPDPLAGQAYNIKKASLGYVCDYPIDDHLAVGIGGVASAYDIPHQIESAYGEPYSYTLFTRLKLY